MIRTSYGIHLIVLEKSPYDADALEYFTVLTDDDDNFDTYVELDATNNEGEVDGRVQNFVNYGFGSGTTAPESKFTDYLIYENYLAESDIEVADATLAAKIETMISSAREYKSGQIVDATYTTWVAYIRTLERETEVADDGLLPDVTGIGE